MIRTGPEVARWVCGKLSSCYQEGAQGIGLEKDGSLVAGVCYDNFNKQAITAHIVVEGRMTPTFLSVIFDYPFRQLGVEKVICPIAETNSKSIRLCSKMGFEREATLSDAHPEGDIYLYSLKRSKCRFTGERYGKQIKSSARA